MTVARNINISSSKLMSMQSIQKGEISITSIITVAIVLVAFLVAAGLVLGSNSSMFDLGAKIEGALSPMSMKFDCTKLDDPNIVDFATGKTHVYPIDMGTNYKVKDVTHVALQFQQGVWPWNTWYLENWNVKCTDGENEYILVNWDTKQWLEDITVIQKTQNSLYGMDAGCGSVVNVAITTGNELFAGSDGDVKFCYFKHR